MLGANRRLRVHRHTPGARDKYGDREPSWTPGEWVDGNLGVRTSRAIVDGVVVTTRELWARVPPGTEVGIRDLIETEDGEIYPVEGASSRRAPWGGVWHVSVELRGDSTDGTP